MELYVLGLFLIQSVHSLPSAGGSSKYPCSDTYHGPHAFSEPETAAVRDHLHAEARTRVIAMYMTIHSYSQFIIIPWSYTDKLPINWQSMYKKALSMADAIGKFSGTEYFVGQSTRTLCTSLITFTQSSFNPTLIPLNSLPNNSPSFSIFAN